MGQQRQGHECAGQDDQAHQAQRGQAHHAKGGSHRLNPLADVAYPRPGQHIHAAHARSPGVWGSAGQSLGPGLRSRSKLHYSSGPVPAPVQDQEGAQASAQAPEERPLSAGVTVQDQRDPGLLSAWGCVLLGVL